MRKLIYLAFFLMTIFEVSGQRVIVQRGEQASQESIEPNRKSNHRLAIKFTPTSLVLGEAPVSVEYNVLDVVTIEAGVGLTFRNRLLDAEIFREFNSFGSNWDDVTYGNGVSFSGEFRLYFDDDDVMNDGTYFGFTYNYRPWKITFNSPENSGLEPYNGYRKWSDFGVVYGYFYELSDIFILDFAFGGGLRSVHRKEAGFVDYGSGMTLQEKEDRYSIFCSLLRIKLGVLL